MRALLLIFTAALGAFQATAQWQTSVHAPYAVVGRPHEVVVMATQGSLPAPCETVRIKYRDNPKADMSPPAGNVQSNERRLVFSAQVGSHPGVYEVHCGLRGEGFYRKVTEYTIRAPETASPLTPAPPPSSPKTAPGKPPAPGLDDPVTGRQLNQQMTQLETRLRNRANREGRRVTELSGQVERMQAGMLTKADANTVTTIQEEQNQLKGTVQQHDQRLGTIDGIRQAQERLDQDMVALRGRVDGHDARFAAHESRMATTEMGAALALEGTSRMGSQIKRWKWCWGFIPCGRQPVVPLDQTRVMWERAQQLRTQSVTSAEQQPSLQRRQ